MYRVNLIKNYIKNSNEIVELAEQECDKFSIRVPGQQFNFVSPYGESSVKSLFVYNMSDKLKSAILKTLSDEDKTADALTINRFDPGDFLKRHKDSLGKFWKFKLIFLRSDKDHFIWYDKDGAANLVNEEPGAYLEMPIHIEHEVTPIDINEKPKFSLVLSWGI
jgi:hypothetical protein